MMAQGVNNIAPCVLWISHEFQKLKLEELGTGYAKRNWSWSWPHNAKSFCASQSLGQTATLINFLGMCLGKLSWGWIELNEEIIWKKIKKGIANLIWLFTMTQEMTISLSKSFGHLIGCIFHFATWVMKPVGQWIAGRKRWEGRKSRLPYITGL